jgi:hypothetical protein
MADDDPSDIRKWLSPKNNTTTPKRRRRVMSTSSSDNERSYSSAQQTPSRSAALPNAGATNNVQPPPPPIAGNGTVATSTNAVDVIELSSSDDSMYIHRRDAQAGGGAAVTSPRPAAAGGGAAIISPRPVAEQRKSSSKGNQPRRNTKRERTRCGTQSRKSQKFTAEAEEVSTDHDSESQSCDESETNAQDLYHEAIMGVRNANHARCQLRSKTINCPVCAKFATFLQHFM